MNENSYNGKVLAKNPLNYSYIILKNKILNIK